MKNTSEQGVSLDLACANPEEMGLVVVRTGGLSSTRDPICCLWGRRRWLSKCARMRPERKRRVLMLRRGGVGWREMDQGEKKRMNEIGRWSLVSFSARLFPVTCML